MAEFYLISTGHTWFPRFVRPPHPKSPGSRIGRTRGAGAEVGRLGCGAHSDYGMLTILLVDDVPGAAGLHPPLHPCRPLAPSNIADY